MDELDPVRVVARLNQAVQLFADDALITALYGIVDPHGHTWSFVNAGHCPAIVRHADGTVAMLDTPPQPPLGVDSEYRCQRCTVESGAVLVLYTDGLVERRDEAMTDRLQQAVDAVRTGPADVEGLADAILDRLLAGGGHDDDVALLVVSIG